MRMGMGGNGNNFMGMGGNGNSKSHSRTPLMQGNAFGFAMYFAAWLTSLVSMGVSTVLNLGSRSRRRRR